MKLAKVNSTYGAPMGRAALHARRTPNLRFELEWCPLTDGDYDAGGAYWGSPDNLWCAEAYLGGRLFVHMFVRANTRAEAMAVVGQEYPRATFEKPNGSLIEQMIGFLQEHADRKLADGEVDTVAEQEIDALQEVLDEIRRAR